MDDFTDLIIQELEVAASRTDGVSSVPAFLTEVLRRQLFASRQRNRQQPLRLRKLKLTRLGNRSLVPTKLNRSTERERKRH